MLVRELLIRHAQSNWIRGLGFAGNSNQTNREQSWLCSDSEKTRYFWERKISHLEMSSGKKPEDQNSLGQGVLSDTLMKRFELSNRK